MSCGSSTRPRSVRQVIIHGSSTKIRISTALALSKNLKESIRLLICLFCEYENGRPRLQTQLPAPRRRTLPKLLRSPHHASTIRPTNDLPRFEKPSSPPATHHPLVIDEPDYNKVSSRAALRAVRAAFQHSHRLARAQQEANLKLRSSNLNNDADLRDDATILGPPQHPLRRNLSISVLQPSLSLLPSTDTRLRPNQLAMEEGKFELTATKEKQEGQAQEARGEGEGGRSEKWFEKVCELDKIRRGFIMGRGVRGWEER
jgi:hypothetical protein